MKIDGLPFMVRHAHHERLVLSYVEGSVLSYVEGSVLSPPKGPFALSLSKGDGPGHFVTGSKG